MHDEAGVFAAFGGIRPAVTELRTPGQNEQIEIELAGYSRMGTDPAMRGKQRLAKPANAAANLSERAISVQNTTGALAKAQTQAAGNASLRHVIKCGRLWPAA